MARTRRAPPAVVTSGPGNACGKGDEYDQHSYRGEGVRLLAWNVDKRLNSMASARDVRTSLAMHDIIVLNEIGACRQLVRRLSSSSLPSLLRLDSPGSSNRGRTSTRERPHSPAAWLSALATV